MSVISEAIKLIDVDQLFEDARENSKECYLCPSFERNDYDDEPEYGECGCDDADQCPAVHSALDKLTSAEGLAEALQRGIKI